MISKGCSYNIFRVMDVKFETPSLELVSLSNEFPEVCPDNLPDVTPERDTDFFIDLFPNTQPISIPLYGMFHLN